jgi:DNA helicase HerA-like ATPase
MTGSGKTGLCIDLLEEAAIDGVPALVIDPKGDLGDLLLTFPNLSASDFRPWIDEDEARRNGKSPDEWAAAQATVEEGPRELGPGRRSHQAAARGGRLRDLHAGLAVGPAALDHQVVRRAIGRLHR